MKTHICTQEAIPQAVAWLQQGCPVAFATETVYGLGAGAFDEKGVRAIFEAKGRPQDNPLIVHLADWEQLAGVAVDVPPLARRLYRRFCPGPLTMILPKAPAVPDVVTAGLPTVGVRWPAHPLARALIRAAGPIAAPSANRSKHVSPTTAQHVYDDLQGKIPLILDGGTCEVGIESTIIDLTQPIPVILRPGAITLDMLAEECMVVNHTGEIKVAKAPGMKYVHYSPTVDCVMCPPDQLADTYHTAVQQGVRAVVLARQSTLDALPPVASRSLGASDAEVMHELYAALREAETQYQLILLEQLPEEGVLASVMNRAKKSAGKKEGTE